MTADAPPSSGATTRSAPLAELLRTLGPPLEYLAADDFRRLDQTRLPLATLAERTARARAEAGGVAEAPLAELEEILEALRGGAAREREGLLRRAHALLPVLRDAAAGWTAYRPTPEPAGPALAALRAGLESLPGVGPKRAAELARFGLRSVEDVLYHLPFRYEDRRALRALSGLVPGEEATAAGEVSRVSEGRAGRRGRRVLEIVLRDAEGLLLLVWFNQIGWFSRRFRPGQRVIVHGKVEVPLGGGPKRMIHPEVETLGADEEPAALARVVPVYEKPTEMHVGTMRRWASTRIACRARYPPRSPHDSGSSTPRARSASSTARRRTPTWRRSARRPPRRTGRSSSTSSSSSSSAWRSAGARSGASRASRSRRRRVSSPRCARACRSGRRARRRGRSRRSPRTSPRPIPCAGSSRATWEAGRRWSRSSQGWS
jgi:ATP-dependent DNA helicase RecG-like protein